jgi:Rhs element Vgr protein
MAQAVETIIEINGHKIKQFTSLTLSQAIYAHHSFRLECPIKEVDENVGGIFKESANLIGLPVHIKVASAAEQSSLFFSGLVTQVEVACNYGQPGNIIIHGMSPTILLENGPHCKSWIRKSVKSMVKEMMKQFPVDGLKHHIDPVYTDTIHYTVQYRETAWQFIKRLAATYGEWLFYDGRQLVLSTSADRTVPLTYGIQLSKFSKEMELKPNHATWAAYDYVKNEVYTSRIENIANEAGHNDEGEYAVKKSEQLYSMNSKYWYHYTVGKKRQLDNIARIQVSKQSSDIIRVNGSSDLPGFQPGDKISVKALNIDDQSDQILGEYKITSIEHNWDGIGNYANNFVAIPASVKVPPMAPVPQPYCEKQPAVVVENHDPEGLGRIQVRFLWMDEKEKSPWLRVATQYAGNAKGLYMMPEIEEEVIVDFVGGDATQPYVMGTVHHGKAKTEFGNAENDIKALQTRSGIKVIMNDKEGSLTLEDKNGNSVQMDGEGTVTMKAKDKMVFECGETKIEMHKEGAIDIKGCKINIDATEELNLRSNDQAVIDAVNEVKVESVTIRLN